MMQIVVPFGFYGWGNIGDEATLNGFSQLLSRTGVSAKVSVGSRNPAHTSRVEPAFTHFSVSGVDPRRWWIKARASAHAFVGGTPIMDVLGEWPLCEVAPLVSSAERWNVPCAFIGVGVEELRHDRSRRVVADEIVPHVLHWSVRSDRDRQRLIVYGASPDIITVAADMAWLIDPATDVFGRDWLRRCGIDARRPLIGVNVVNENSVFDRQPQMVDALAAACDELADKMDATVIFLSNEVREGAGFDKAAARRIISRMKRVDRAVLVPNEYFSPCQMLSIIDCCDLTVSMRYHFCLFSALQGVPFIAIQRSDKVSDLCWDMNWPSKVVPPHFDAAEIVEQGLRLTQNLSAAHGHLRQSVETMRERALCNITALHALNDPQVAHEVSLAAR